MKKEYAELVWLVRHNIISNEMDVITLHDLCQGGDSFMEDWKVFKVINAHDLAWGFNYQRLADQAIADYCKANALPMPEVDGPNTAIY